MSGAREDDDEAVQILCEAVHAGLRKGCNDGHDAWQAIAAMDPGEWGKAIAFAVSGMRSMGVRIVFDKK